MSEFEVITLNIHAGGRPIGAEKAPFIDDKEQRSYHTVANGTAYRWTGRFIGRPVPVPEGVSLPTHFYGATWTAYQLEDGRILYWGYVSGDAYRFDSGKIVIK